MSDTFAELMTGWEGLQHDHEPCNACIASDKEYEKLAEQYALLVWASRSARRNAASRAGKAEAQIDALEQELAHLEAQVEALQEVRSKAQDVIDDWPNTLYGNDDSDFKHWVILRRLRDALLKEEASDDPD